MVPLSAWDGEANLRPCEAVTLLPVGARDPDVVRLDVDDAACLCTDDSDCCHGKGEGDDGRRAED